MAINRNDPRAMIEMFATALAARFKKRAANVRHRIKNSESDADADRALADALEEVALLVEDARNVFLDDTRRP